MTTAEHVHFIGIGGYGMSAIARVMLDLGYRVTGSDLARQELVDKLAARGAEVYIGHEAKNISGADIVVYSTALSKDNVEMLEAERLQIPILHRSQMLARLLNDRSGIAVAGAHGKTTTSSMISLVMERAGLDPTYIIGGEIVNVGSNARAGLGEYLVAEADESDGSFLNYRPLFSIVTNIEAEHLENYDGDFNNLLAAYRKFLIHTKEDGLAIVCLDDPYLKTMLGEVKSRIITFALEDRSADYTAEKLEFVDRTVSFDVLHQREKLGRVKLSVPGRHNVYNALATIITCLQAGISFDQIAEYLFEFSGAKRRFQVLSEDKGITVIDDYAHHPTEVHATITAAKATGKRIIAVFQPHRYSRTFHLFDPFSRCFGEADEVVITPIYSPAGEERIEGISSEKLVELIAQNSNPNVTFLPSKEETTDYLLGHLRPGDLVLTMGAGDIWKVAEQLAKAFKS